MKTCSKCKKEKSLELFNKTHRWCKPCVKDYDHNRHKRQRKKIIAQKKARKIEINEWYMELKATLKCAWCPENHPACLTFHHIDPTTKETEVAQAVASHWSKEHILQEIEKCIVLCSNCHTKHHFGDKWKKYL